MKLLIGVSAGLIFIRLTAVILGTLGNNICSMGELESVLNTPALKDENATTEEAERDLP